jgi:hypothetical protein
MTKKTDPQDPGPVPGEERAKRPRRPGLPLNERSADLVRRAAEYTGQTIGAVLEAIASGDDLTRFVEKGCMGLAQAHDRQREAERNKLFGPLKPLEGEP